MLGNFDPYREWLGIPPEEQPPNLYRLIGVDEGESDVQLIRQAASRQACADQEHSHGRECHLRRSLDQRGQRSRANPARSGEEGEVRSEAAGRTKIAARGTRGCAAGGCQRQPGSQRTALGGIGGGEIEHPRRHGLVRGSRQGGRAIGQRCGGAAVRSPRRDHGHRGRTSRPIHTDLGLPGLRRRPGVLGRRRGGAGDSRDHPRAGRCRAV